MFHSSLLLSFRISPKINLVPTQKDPYKNQIKTQSLGGEALFRSYGCFFAEFLGGFSLVRLGLLDLTTCVGLRYGFYIVMLRNFSWKRALRNLQGRTPIFMLRLDLRLPDFPKRHPYATNRNPIICFVYYTPSFHRTMQKLRNINLMSIGYGIRHPLRPD